MADISISKFTTQIPRVGATPATPGFAESEGQDPVAPSGTSIVVVSDTNKVSYNVADSKNATEKNQARVNIGSTSATPQVIATAGAINDLATTSNHLVFTGASVVLSGIVAGLDGEEFTILNASGTNLELLSQSALSVSGNRFASGVIVPNLSIVRIKYRTTTARWVLENVGINDGRYVRKDVADTKTGDLTFANNSSLLWNTGAGIGNNIFRFNSFQDAAFQLQQNGTTYLRSSFASILVNRTISIYSGDIASATPGGTLNASLNPNGRFFHQRSGASNESVRRDELYLNYSETVSTAGTINNLAINADCKLLILTGADDLTGVVPVDNTRLLRIEARSGNRIIRHESASSTAANRFSIGADLTINAGEVYQFIYTDSRWRFINDTRDQFAVKTTATADQTLPSGVLTILDYDSTLLNNSTNTYTVGTDGRITINTTGVYTITAGVVIEADAVTALESAFLGIFRNGDLVAISSINTTIAAGAQSGLSTSTILSLTATDIIDCRALVNSVGGVANGLARRLGTLLGANATQVNSLSITKNSM